MVLRLNIGENAFVLVVCNWLKPGFCYSLFNVEVCGLNYSVYFGLCYIDLVQFVLATYLVIL